MSTPGYSGTPLIKKLGIKPGFHCRVINSPEAYFDWLGELLPEITFNEVEADLDFVHWFVTDQVELQEKLEPFTQTIKSTGMIWMSWPKGTSNIPTDLNRDIIRAYILNHSYLVDIKVCAVSTDWSGLKFMIRKEKRGKL